MFANNIGNYRLSIVHFVLGDIGTYISDTAERYWVTSGAESSTPDTNPAAATIGT